MTDNNYEKKIQADYLNTIVPLMDKHEILLTEFPNYINSVVRRKEELPLKLKIDSLIRYIFFKLSSFDDNILKKIKKISADEDKKLVSYNDACKIFYGTIQDGKDKIRAFSYIETYQLFVFINESISICGLTDIGYWQKNYKNTLQG